MERLWDPLAVPATGIEAREGRGPVLRGSVRSTRARPPKGGALPQETHPGRSTSGGPLQIDTRRLYGYVGRSNHASACLPTPCGRQTLWPPSVAIALFGASILQLCFIDEAGDLGALRDPPAPNDQPVLVVAGLFVDAARLATLTHDYLDLKHRFFPNLNYRSIRRLDRVLPEIKGAELRKHATRGNARQKLHAGCLTISTREAAP